MNKLSGLDTFREEIDILDSKIVELLEARFELCSKIGMYKKDNNLPILNENRELEVLNKNLNKIVKTEFSENIEEVLVAIMNTSKELQNKIISDTKEDVL